MSQTPAERKEDREQKTEQDSEIKNIKLLKRTSEKEVYEHFTDN